MMAYLWKIKDGETGERWNVTTGAGGGMHCL
jgi:hypothetical protein